MLGLSLLINGIHIFSNITIESLVVDKYGILSRSILLDQRKQISCSQLRIYLFQNVIEFGSCYIAISVLIYLSDNNLKLSLSTFSRDYCEHFCLTYGRKLNLLSVELTSVPRDICRLFFRVVFVNIDFFVNPFLDYVILLVINSCDVNLVFVTIWTSMERILQVIKLGFRKFHIILLQYFLEVFDKDNRGIIRWS